MHINPSLWILDLFVSILYVIGNIKNPSLNRWGMNLLWYNFWFTDRNFHLNLQVDYFINTLIYTYVYFGLIKRTHPFHNMYFVKNYCKLKVVYATYNVNYYKSELFTNKVSGVREHYALRDRHEGLYNMKISIYRYQNWVLINFFSFKVIKTSRRRGDLDKWRLWEEPHFSFSRFFRKQKPALKRIKFIIYLFITSKMGKNNNYLF